MQRFVVAPTTHSPVVDAYYIKDIQHNQWDMPIRAVSINLCHEVAVKVAQSLNDEWNAFVNSTDDNHSHPVPAQP